MKTTDVLQQGAEQGRLRVDWLQCVRELVEKGAKKK
jgi:hypothetical protein